MFIFLKKDGDTKNRYQVSYGNLAILVKKIILVLRVCLEKDGKYIWDGERKDRSPIFTLFQTEL
jgi:hypothetical protein